MVVAGPDETATVRFGNPTVGSPFPPPDGHDASSSAIDNLIPRTVVIAEDGSVTYEISVLFGFHQPMVYRPGTTPEDIVVPDFPPDPTIDFDGGLLVESGPVVTPADGLVTWTTGPDTFAESGRYLVLCNFTPHFAFFDMYGWVNVN